MISDLDSFALKSIGKSDFMLLYPCFSRPVVRVKYVVFMHRSDRKSTQDMMIKVSCNKIIRSNISVGNTFRVKPILRGFCLIPQD